MLMLQRTVSPWRIVDQIVAPDGGYHTFNAYGAQLVVTFCAGGIAHIGLPGGVYAEYAVSWTGIPINITINHIYNHMWPFDPVNPVWSLAGEPFVALALRSTTQSTMYASVQQHIPTGWGTASGTGNAGSTGLGPNAPAPWTPPSLTMNALMIAMVTRPGANDIATAPTYVLRLLITNPWMTVQIPAHAVILGDGTRPGMAIAMYWVSRPQDFVAPTWNFSPVNSNAVGQATFPLP